MKTKHLMLSAIAIIALGWLANTIVINADKENITDQHYQDRDKLKSLSTEAQGVNGYIEWMQKIRVNPKTGTISQKDIDSARKSYQKNFKNNNLEGNLGFQFMGPDDVGGRTRAIIVDNRDNKTLFAGGVAGGLWKSTTAGRAWLPVATEQFENLNISTICQDKDGVIYVGTGESFPWDPNTEGNTSTVGFWGQGIWKSTDGINFSSLEETYNKSYFKYVNELACRNGILYAATNEGLYVSSDKGAHWQNKFLYTGTTSDVAVTSNNKIIFVRQNKVYVSTPDGAMVDKSSQFDNHIDRIELAIAPSNEDIMYALCSYEMRHPSNINKYFNLYRSEDAGENWESVLEQHTPQVDLFRNRTQGNYDNVIAVFPDNPNKVILGGIDLWVWNKGSIFEQITLWNAKGSLKYVHADQHEIVFDPNYKENKTIYFGTDGGIFISKDAGVTFKAMNKNYCVTQYFAIDCGPNGEVLGGTQDNGTPYIDLLQPSDLKTSFQFTGGDGGCVAISELYPGAIFSTSYYSKLMRSNENGQSEVTLQVNPFDAGNKISTATQLKPGAEGVGNPFVTPISLWESFDYKNNKMYIPFVIDTVVKPDNNGVPNKIHKFGEGFVFEVPSMHVDNKTFEYVLTAEDLARSGKDSLSIGDTIAVREKFSSLMAIGGFGNIFFTREALNFKNKQPNWDAVVGILKDSTNLGTPNNMDIGLGTVERLLWAADGDALYALSGSSLFRFTGFKDAYSYSGLTYCNRVSYPSDSSFVAADTITTVVDTTYIVADTITTVVDTTYIVADTITTVVDTTYIVADTIITAVDTTYIAADTTYISDTKYIAADTTYISDTTYIAADTTYTLDTTYIAADTTITVKDPTYQMGVIGDDMVWVNQEQVFTIGNIKGEKIYSFSNGAVATSIAIDPNDINRLIVTCGGYGGHNKVFYTENVLDETPHFVSIGDQLPKIPVYASLISDTVETGADDLILVGTEHGVFSTKSVSLDNPAATTWVHETSVPNVPVFFMVQQTQPNGYLKGVCPTGVKNSGVIYAATHGMGVWKMSKYARPYNGFKGVLGDKVKPLSVDVYPNPTRNYFNISFNSDKSELVTVELFTLEGKLIRTQYINAQYGDNTDRIDVTGIQKGIYIVSVSNGETRKTQKLIVE